MATAQAKGKQREKFELPAKDKDEAAFKKLHELAKAKKKAVLGSGAGIASRQSYLYGKRADLRRLKKAKLEDKEIIAVLSEFGINISLATLRAFWKTMNKKARGAKTEVTKTPSDNHVDTPSAKTSDIRKDVVGTTSDSMSDTDLAEPKHTAHSKPDITIGKSDGKPGGKPTHEPVKKTALFESKKPQIH